MVFLKVIVKVVIVQDLIEQMAIFKNLNDMILKTRPRTPSNGPK